jgi:hypothetical protein
MIYLASPYTHDDPAVEQLRYTAAARMTACLIGLGAHCYSPIVYGHHLVEFGIPGTWDAWEAHDKHMLSLSDHVRVLMLPGYESSVGIERELCYAQELGKAIYYIEPLEGTMDSECNMTSKPAASLWGGPCAEGCAASVFPRCWRMIVE